jgi:hypothetical protein
MRINLPFGVQEYPHRHRGAGSQSAVNMMPAAQAAGSKGPIVMQRIEGFGRGLVNSKDFVSVGASKPSGGQVTGNYLLQHDVRGMRAIGAFLYFIVNNWLYRSNTSGTVTAATGDAIAGEGRCWMEHNGTQLVIVNDLGDGYVCTLSTFAVAEIADADFQLASWVQWMDQYFIFGKKDSSQFFISGLADPTAYNALEVATAETIPDNLVSGLRDHRDLILFGTESSEFWYNNAGVDFPFARAPDGAIEVGCAAPHSPARLDNQPVWLATERGGYSVRRLEGRTPMRISTAALDDEIHSYDEATFGAVSDAYGMAWQFAGHSYYALTFPTAGRTWVYDAATNLWHRRLSQGMSFWRIGSVEPFGGRVYAQDLFDLNIRAFARGQQTDIAWRELDYPGVESDIDGSPIPWEIVTAPVATDRRPTSFLRVELEVDAGMMSHSLLLEQEKDIPQVFLSWSDDDGRTWSNAHGRSIGAHGKFNTRLVWTNLGMTRTGRVFKFSGGGHAPEAIISASAEIAVGR